MKPFVGKKMDAETLIVSKVRQSQKHECIFFSYMELRAPSQACTHTHVYTHIHIYLMHTHTHAHTQEGRT